MTDTLYGADLGATASDLAGNVKDGQTFNVYSDPQGATQFANTKAVTSTFAVGAGTGGVVTATPLGRIMFYAQDTDRTLWLKNGTNFWAVNPTSPTDIAQGRVATLSNTVAVQTAALDARIDDVESDLASLQNASGRSWQMWRGRMGAIKNATSGNYTSLNFGGTITTPTGFSVTLTNDAISVGVAGWYRLAFRAAFAANSTGYRTAVIVLNSGSTTLDSVTTPNGIAVEDDRNAAIGINSGASVAEDFYLTPADSFMFAVLQNSGGVLAVNNGRHLTSASIEYLGTA